MITDEMVDKAYEALDTPESDAIYGITHEEDVRRALEAVAPMILADVQRELDACNGALKNSGAAYALVLADRDKWIVQGLREAIKVIDASEGDIDYAKFKLESRIQELDPQ